MLSVTFVRFVALRSLFGNCSPDDYYYFVGIHVQFMKDN